MKTAATTRPDAPRPDPAPPEAARPEHFRRIATRTDIAGVADTAHVNDAQIRIILDVSRMLAVPTELDTILSRIAETCTQLVNCERASIFLYDAKAKELWTKVALGTTEIRVPCTAGIVGAAFTQNSVIHVPDPYKDSRFNPEPDRKSGFVTRNLLSSPMVDLDGRPMGVIQAINKRDGDYDENDPALIRLLSEQAGVAIQRHRLQLQAMEALALKHEMDLARRTQEALIPKQPPRVPGLHCCGWTLPASVTGGDCFDLWKLPDGRLGILLADASGHGIGPALVVSQARTLVRALSEMMSDPHEILVQVNNRMAEDLEWGQFVTAFLGFMAGDGTLHWSSAGHGPLLVRQSIDAPLTLLDPPVQPLGVVVKWFDPAPPPIQFQPGGQLILMTDGIFEASCGGEQMGVERMCHVVDQHRNNPPEAILGALREEASRWYGGQDPLDDQTVVIVEREM